MLPFQRLLESFQQISGKFSEISERFMGDTGGSQEPFRNISRSFRVAEFHTDGYKEL